MKKSYNGLPGNFAHVSCEVGNAIYYKIWTL